MRAISHRGAYWAAINGAHYGTVGAMRIKNAHYSQEYSMTNQKARKLAALLAAKKRVIIRDEIRNEKGVYEHQGYLTLCKLDNLKVGGSRVNKFKIDFDVTDQIARLEY
jgi:hypothetical protein